MSLYTFINWDDIEVRGDRSGKKKTTCPNCSADRKKKKDPCLYVNFTSGIAKCYNCPALSFRDDGKTTKRDYTPPVQTWQNHTNLSSGLVGWAKESRRIDLNTLTALGVTEEKIYQPAAGKELNSICFNYFLGEQVVNKKYRTADKKFTSSSNAKSIFYNINSIVGAKECWIVEGEFDVLALHQIGIKNVVSVPNGANDNDEYWKNSEPYLKDVERFVLALDNDEKGNELKEKVAQRLGRYRCDYVEWKNKDANGDLIAGVLRRSSQERKRFPVSGTFSTKDLEEEILKLYDTGLPETLKVKGDWFGKGHNEKEFNQVFSTMRGHLLTVTGIPSHGKSNFSEWYGLNLMEDNDLKLSFFSPEHSPMALHQSTFVQKAVGKPFFGNTEGIERATREDVKRYVDWADQRLYLTSPEKGEAATWPWLLEKFKEQMYNFGVDCFFIDAFNKVKLPRGVPKLDAINDILTDLTSFAQSHNVVIFLVAHPTKMTKNEQGLYSMPSLYDVSGSADFRNQTHDGFGIYRFFGDEATGDKGKTTFANLKTKMSFQGIIGAKYDMDYIIHSGRYHGQGTPPPTHDMTIRQYSQTVMQPNTSFDDSYNPNETIEPDRPFEPNNEEPPF